MAASKKSAVPDYDLMIGEQLDNAEKQEVEEIIVDNLCDGPDMVHVRLNAHDDQGIGAWIESDDIKLGAPIEVKTGFHGVGSKELVFKGELIGWEPHIKGKEPAGITVRGYNKLHRLTRGRKSRPFSDMTLADIAGKVAGDWDLKKGGIKDTPVGKPYVYQPSITDLDFLRMLASRVGFEVCCDLEENLVFGPPRVDGSAVATLKWGDNLTKFKSRLSTGSQISKVKVSGWDVKKMARIEETAAAGDVISAMGGDEKGPEAASKFEKGEVEYHVQLSSVYSKQDLKEMAKGIMNQIALNYVIADLEAEGENKIVAGTVIKVEGVKKRFDGDYYVVRSRHIVRPNQKMPDAGYVTHVTARRMGAG